MNFFAIVGKDDQPLYQAAFVANPKTVVCSCIYWYHVCCRWYCLQNTQFCHLHQFLIHAALDCTDEQVWTTNNLYLKAVDFFHDMYTSAYVTPGHCRFMMLHDQPKMDDNLRSFFQEAHELYLKVSERALRPHSEFFDRSF